MYDFNKNQEVEDIATVPEDFRPFYVESEDGKHKLDTENPIVRSSVANLTKVSQSLNAARAEAAGLKGKSVDLSALGEFGDTPEKILETVNEKIAEAQASAKANGDQDLQRQIEKIKADLAKAHAGDLEKRDKRIQGLTGQLYEKMVKSEAKTALAGANVIDVDLALPFVEKHVKVVENDGNFGVAVVDAAGDVRYSGVTGAPMTVKELVLEIKGQEKFNPLFKSEAPAGGGALPNSSARPFTPGKSTEGMSSVDKISAGLKRGLHSTKRS